MFIYKESNFIFYVHTVWGSVAYGQSHFDDGTVLTFHNLGIDKHLI